MPDLHKVTLGPSKVLSFPRGSELRPHMLVIGSPLREAQEQPWSVLVWDCGFHEVRACGDLGVGDGVAQYWSASPGASGPSRAR